MSNGSWISEGVSTRSSVWNVKPVRHLLVQGDGGAWRLWCSYGPAREDTIVRMGSRRFCPKCKELAQEAADEGMLGREDADQWPVNWPEEAS
jgi:hypothetical protein